MYKKLGMAALAGAAAYGMAPRGRGRRVMWEWDDRPFFFGKGSPGWQMKPKDTRPKYYFDDIAVAIRTKHPELVGSHIFEQLRAVGLSEEFDGGSTPVQLPYSFSDYDPKGRSARGRRAEEPYAVIKRELRLAGKDIDAGNFAAAHRRIVACSPTPNDVSFLLTKSQIRKMREWNRGGQRAITTRQRRRMPQAEFALPITKQSGKFKASHSKFVGAYPMNDKSHAVNARSRATQMLNKGYLSKSEAQTIYDRTYTRSQEMGWGLTKKVLVKREGRYTSVLASTRRRRAA